MFERSLNTSWCVKILKNGWGGDEHEEVGGFGSYSRDHSS